VGSTELLSLIALIVAGLGYYENRRSNNIQLRQAVALEESNRIALGQGAETMAAPLSAPVVFTPSRWPALVLLILLLMNLGVTGFDYYERHHSVGIAASTPSDSRDPTPKEADVIRDLAIKGSFKIAVYCLTDRAGFLSLRERVAACPQNCGMENGRFEQNRLRGTQQRPYCVCPTKLFPRRKGGV